MTCSAYPLDTLDTIRPDGSTSKFKNLVDIVNFFRLRLRFDDGNQRKYLRTFGYDCFRGYTAFTSRQMESFRSCKIDRNNMRFSFQRKLYERLALLALHLVCLCFVVYLRPTERERLYMEEPRWDDYVRIVSNY